MQSPRVRSVSSQPRTAIADRWRCATTPAGAVSDASGVSAAAWITAQVPGTAAGALRAAGQWDWHVPHAFDGEDWWWRTSFDADGAMTLGFDGLATLADVWLDGAHVLTSSSMWQAHELPVSLAPGMHELVIRCRALLPELAMKRARPRWRVPMLEHQQLRWVRTTLLGRTPGWSPPCPAVGPWRGVWLARRAAVRVEDVKLTARVDGDDGVVELDVELAGIAGGALLIERDGVTVTAALTKADEPGRWHARAIVPHAVRWWPHTHGEPARYTARIAVSTGGGKEAPTTIELGALGFRTIELDASDDGFTLRVNGVRVFCRGACWTPLDVVTLGATAEATRAAVDQARAAGMNMLRLSGTMTYADDALLDALDEAGILLWQDLMFANMDYPEDAAFTAVATAEADHELARLQARPCVAVVCGNSEGAQQAAMWGAARTLWEPALFGSTEGACPTPAALPNGSAVYTTLRDVARSRCPDAVYVPSSASGGAFPHAANAGPSSYYGVGAYLRPLEDARRADVKFASECLAFANVPYDTGALRVHSPAWKARAPRDLGAGWDFDDVRDHYVRLLHGVDPAALRYADHERYLALGRATTGEVMARTIGEWRRARSRCGGALLWWLRDLWPGAGWGVIDARGAVKPCWHALRRAQQPVAISISDEGGNGLVLHDVNDRAEPFVGLFTVPLFRGFETEIRRGGGELTVPAHTAIEIPIASLYPEFYDLSWAYRFGPPAVNVVFAALLTSTGETVSAAIHLPAGPPPRESNIGLTARAVRRDDGAYALTIATRRFAYGVTIEAPGYTADDDYFDLAPDQQQEVVLRGTGALRGHVRALNAEASARIEV
jgi:beta-mannosidase